MVYKKFIIENYKGIENIELDFSRNDLVLLLGINESGKTTILKAIEAFDYRNDPISTSLKSTFLSSVRNKSNINFTGDVKITAEIYLDNEISREDFSKEISMLRKKEISKKRASLVENFLHYINSQRTISISRCFNFNNGQFMDHYYEINTEHYIKNDKYLEKLVSKAIVGLCAFIMYFEDFRDIIPETITVKKTSTGYNEDWYEIIDGLFYSSNQGYNIDTLRNYYPARKGDASTLLNRVNTELNKVFTDKWKKLSGVKDINKARIEYNEKEEYFEFEIVDNDDTTYKIDERSKGARWYLSFLMKTEFRRKKLRNIGKTIFLLDEPASNLHSSAQTNMIQDFERLSEDTTVIYSTHSQYLISTSNIKNTYIVNKQDGIISCTKWGDYIHGKNVETSYYQPLYDHLQIVPNSFTIPWNKALIVEGPTDFHVLQVMYQLIFDKKPDFVIYPGTSACKLHDLISLNLGWGSNFVVLLDSDKEGKKYRKQYIEDFQIDENSVMCLPIENMKIEKYFSNRDKREISVLAFDNCTSDNLTKKQFAASLGIIFNDESNIKRLKNCLDSETIEKFSNLFNLVMLKLNK